jgi:hypothetical protein
MTIRIGSIRGGAFAIGDNATVSTVNVTGHGINRVEEPGIAMAIENSLPVMKVGSKSYTFHGIGGSVQFSSVTGQSFRVGDVLVQCENGELQLENGTPLKEDSLRDKGIRVTITKEG